MVSIANASREIRVADEFLLGSCFIFCCSNVCCGFPLVYRKRYAHGSWDLSAVHRLCKKEMALTVLSSSIRMTFLLMGVFNRSFWGEQQPRNLSSAVFFYSLVGTALQIATISLQEADKRSARMQ